MLEPGLVADVCSYQSTFMEILKRYEAFWMQHREGVGLVEFARLTSIFETWDNGTIDSAKRIGVPACII